MSAAERKGHTVRELRWNCREKKKCYRALMPRLGVFDECFDGGIGMSDVDGIVEIAGHVLMLEFKAPGGRLTTGQRIMFERMTAIGPRFTVMVVSGLPEAMEVDTIQVYERGKAGPSEPTTLRELKARIFAWAERAKASRIRPSKRETT